MKGKFCRMCGAPLIPSASVNGSLGAGQPQGQNVGVNQTQAPYTPQRNAAVRKKKSRIPAIIAAVLACLFIVGGAGILLGGKLIRMASPVKYYQSIEKKELATLTAHTANFAEFTGHGAETTLSLNLTDDGKGLLGDADTSWLNTLALNISSAEDEARSYSEGTISINDSKIIDFETLSELPGGESLMKLPDFSPLYIILPSDSRFTGFMSIFGSSAPDMDAVNKVLCRYGEIVIENVDQVEKSKETVTVGSTTATYDVLVATIDSKTAANIAHEISESAKDDRDLEKLIRSRAERSGEDPDASYNEFLQDLDEAAAYDETAENTVLATMTLYVDKNGEVCGRRYVSADQPDTANYYLTAWDGKNFETEASLPGDDGVLSFTGGGTKSGNKIGGDFSLRSGDVLLWTVHVDDFDKKAAKDGKLYGSFTFAPGKDYIDESGESPMMATFRYQFDIASENGKMDATVSLFSDTATLGSLQIDSKKKNVSIPSVGDGDKVDYETYLNSIDQEAASEKLKNALRNAGVPEEYLN